MLLVAPIAFALVAGCANCLSGPPVTARGITSADATAGLRGFAMDVLVTDGPGGAPIEGAGVVVYYGGTTAGEWSGPRVEVGPDRVLVEPINDTGTVESREVLRMMTDGSGVATARVPGNRIVGVVVAKDGFTEEWLPAVASGDSGGGGELVVPLYRQSIELDMDGVWGPGGASTGFATESQYQWDPHPVAFADSEEANRGYAARVTEMTVTLAWTNGLNGGGDLGIGLGPPEDGPRYFADDGNNVGSGQQSESTTVQLAELREHGILGAPSVQAGAATKSGFVAPFGLPYTMHIEARFDTARAAFASCNLASSQDDSDGLGAGVPGPGVFAALAVLGLVAGVSKRRGNGR